MTELQKHINANFGIINQDLETLSSLFTEIKLERDAFFLKKNQYCNKLSFIQSGHLRIFTDFNGKEITQWISSKSTFVTELNSFMFHQKSRWNIQALTDCTLFTIEKENYNSLNTTIKNWHKIEKQFIASCFIKLEDRVFSHLSLNAEERYLLLFEHNKELFNIVPLQYLASMLGMTPETFSRIRNKINS